MFDVLFGRMLCLFDTINRDIMQKCIATLLTAKHFIPFLLVCVCVCNNIVILFHFFSRYTAGISYFLVVFTVCDFDEKEELKILPALGIALLVTYRGPSMLAKLRITQEELEAKEIAKSQILPTSSPEDSAADRGKSPAALYMIYIQLHSRHTIASVVKRILCALHLAADLFHVLSFIR